MIMTRALSQSGFFSLNSYDRFFPNQDFLPSGGFGNLIALPLQYESRKNGKTVFVDDKLNPYENQWEYLCKVKRLSRDIIVKILNDISSLKEQLEISDNVQQDTNKIPIYEIWESLVNDNERLKLVANDIVNAIKNQRFPLILSDRKDHLYKLKDMIETLIDFQGTKCFLFEGDVGKKERVSALLEINEMIKRNEKPYILSTGSLIGEGFDMPQLDTLFLTMPLSFKGRVVQYAGRLQRPYTGKNEVIIYDYCDSNIGLTVSMFKKRISAYKNIGYKIELTGNYKIDKWIGSGK